MKKLFDAFTLKGYEFVVKEKNMIDLMNMIHTVKSVGNHGDDMNVSDRGLKDEPNNWSIITNLTSCQWYNFLELCDSKGYQLVIKKDPNKMYFTKIKES